MSSFLIVNHNLHSGSNWIWTSFAKICLILWTIRNSVFPNSKSKFAKSVRNFHLGLNFKVVSILFRKQDELPKIAHSKSFFFYPQKSVNETIEDNTKLVEQLIDECKRLARQCDELKVKLSPWIFTLMDEIFLIFSHYQSQNYWEYQVQLKNKKVEFMK